MQLPATAGPPTSTAGRKLNIRGGPAQVGICLFSASHLLLPDFSTLRFAALPRPACPALQVKTKTSLAFLGKTSFMHLFSAEKDDFPEAWPSTNQGNSAMLRGSLLGAASPYRRESAIATVRWS